MIKSLGAALIAASFVLAGCNTMSGMGEDIRQGGKKLGIGGSSATEQTDTATDAMPAQPGSAIEQPAGSTGGGHQSDSMMDRAKDKAHDMMH